MTIQFTPIKSDGVFILAFGNLNEDGTIDDKVINNNGDRNKIIATVVAAVHDFTHHYPDKFVAFLGSTKERNRLYRGVLSIYLAQWRQNYTIWGLKENNGFELFEKSKSYSGYLIKRKR
ncbi:MAG TPA: hypothetical protein VHN59_14365 [Chitinophagaceae bacterium]|nr:hypothetical protein [Chitinophagaceae bacterium]